TDTDRERIRALLNHEETPERINRVSIGIRNVDQRLKMLYDDRCGLTIQADADGHTVSVLTLRKEGSEAWNS
nr:hypothetical protein [Lachnospiraceae bacterium]